MIENDHLAWEGLLLMTDVATTCGEANFIVKCLYWLWRWLPHRFLYSSFWIICCQSNYVPIFQPMKGKTRTLHLVHVTFSPVIWASYSNCLELSLAYHTPFFIVCFHCHLKMALFTLQYIPSSVELMICMVHLSYNDNLVYTPEV